MSKPPSKPNLQKRLDEIKQQGLAAFGQYQSSRTTLYRTFAKGYLLWRDCDNVPGLLDKEYKKAGIKSNRLSDNRINFIPFVRLMFGFSKLTPATKTKSSHWSSVFRALDDDFNERPQYYATKPEMKLVELIETRGGTTEIVKNDDSPQAADDDTGYKPPSKKEQEDTALAVARHRMEQLVSNAPKAFAVADKMSKRVPVNENGLVAFIGKRTASGKIELVATTADPAALQAVAVSSLRDYSEDIDPSLRTLAEVIHTQTFPQLGKPTNKDQEKLWRRVVETHETGIAKTVLAKDRKTGKSSYKREKLTNPRRLLILGDRNQIIYGRMREMAAAVTVLQPKLKLVQNRAVLLKTEERRLFEVPILDGSLAVHRATPTDRLTPVKRPNGNGYDLVIENTATKKTRTAHFYEYQSELGRSPTNFQPIFNATKNYKPTWSFSVPQEWFVDLRAKWLDRWFETLGKDTRILRSDSRVFELKIKAKQLAIRFEIDDDRYADKHPVAIPKAKLVGPSTQAILVASLDLAPVLYNLSEIAVKGDILVSGNAHALVFSFATDVGEFTIAMPAIKKVAGTFAPDRTHFSKAE